MANVYAVKSGNWSDTTVWNTGALPTTADYAYSNGFTVTIDGSYTVLGIRNAASSPIVAGGTFSPANGSVLTCTVSLLGSVAAIGVYTFTLSAGQSATINSTITGGGVSLSYSVHMNGAGTLTINGTVTTSGNFQNPTSSIYTDTGFTSSGVLNITGNLTQSGQYVHPCLVVNGAGTINIVGNVTCQSNWSNGQAAIHAQGSGTINITGNMLNTSTAVAAQCSAIYSSGSNTINITGVLNATTSYLISAGAGGGTITITGGVSCVSVAAINASIASTLFIYGTIQAGAVASVVSSSTSAINVFSGPIINNVATMAVYAYKMYLSNTPSTYWTMTGQDLTTNRTLYTADSIANHPATNNVRSGVAYAYGSMTGTLAMPPPSSVRAGVPTDNTVGTGAITAADFWNWATANATTAGSMAERLKNCATVDTTGQQIAALS